MLKASQRLLKSNNHLEVFQIINGKIGVNFSNCWVKDDCFLIGEFGRGDTFEEACEDYIDKIQGKTLVFEEYGRRREVSLI